MTTVTNSPGSSITIRLRRFWAKPLRGKLESLTFRWKSLLGSRPETLILPFGSKWLPENGALDGDLRSGSFEGAETRFVTRFLKSGMTVFDIGAHHGYYTLLASQRVGNTGKVLAFEPSARERKRLRRHIRLNGCSNVRVESVALGSTKTKGDLFVVQGIGDYCNSLRPPSVQAATKKVRVKVVPLDSMLRQDSAEQVDLIKLDAEGAELDILKGAIRLLQARRRPVLLVEIAEVRTAPWGYSARETVEFLENQRYNWFSITCVGDLEPFTEDCDLTDTNLVAIPEERCEEVQRLLGGSC
jgi:FkbM family methyltransferase